MLAGCSAPELCILPRSKDAGARLEDAAKILTSCPKAAFLRDTSPAYLFEC